MPLASFLRCLVPSVSVSRKPGRPLVVIQAGRATPAGRPTVFLVHWPEVRVGRWEFWLERESTRGSRLVEVWGRGGGDYALTVSAFGWRFNADRDDWLRV